MLCFQEHHLNSRRITSIRNLLRSSWIYEWVRLLDPIDQNGPSHVQAKEVLHGGRFQHTLILISGKLIGFLNVYALNFVTGRTRLWNRLLQDLPVAQHWCMCGD